MTMNYDSFNIDGVEGRWAHFAPVGRAAEHHLVLTTEPCGTFDEQLERINTALANIDNTPGFNCELVTIRFFVSDIANQIATIKREFGAGRSIVGQPPLCGAKVAAWAWYIENAWVECPTDDVVVADHGEYSHIFENVTVEGDPCAATEAMLNEVGSNLYMAGMLLDENLMRTWLYVRDIDVNYGGVVEGRNRAFANPEYVDLGLSSDTHYVASTGIGAMQPRPEVKVSMEAYCVNGLQPEQVGWLYAKSHLNRTSDYGVAFERGTTIDYGDRRHVIISGTASIDRSGRIVHHGDVVKQTQRMLNNVKALLDEAHASFADLSHAIVYLRDMADYTVVRREIEAALPEVPTLIVLAPVCRQGWLIEMECMAIVERTDDRFAPF